MPEKRGLVGKYAYIVFRCIHPILSSYLKTDLIYCWTIFFRYNFLLRVPNDAFSVFTLPVEYTWPDTKTYRNIFSQLSIAKIKSGVKLKALQSPHNDSIIFLILIIFHQKIPSQKCNWLRFIFFIHLFFILFFSPWENAHFVRS